MVRVYPVMAVLTAACLLFIGLAGSALAQTASPVAAVPDFQNLRMDQITDDVLGQFLDLAAERKIPIEVGKAFYAKLNDQQWQRLEEMMLSDSVASKLGLSGDKWWEMVERDRRQGQSLKGNTSCGQQAAPVTIGQAGPLSEIWRQDIELVGGGTPYIWLPSSYWQDQWCDGTDDWDWVYEYYPIDYAENANGLKWDTTDTLLFAYIHLFYKGNLTGFAYGWDNAYYCIGEGAVVAGSGSYLVSQRLYMAYRP